MTCVIAKSRRANSLMVSDANTDVADFRSDAFLIVFEYSDRRVWNVD